MSQGSRLISSRSPQARSWGVRIGSEADNFRKAIGGLTFRFRPDADVGPTRGAIPYLRFGPVLSVPPPVARLRVAGRRAAFLAAFFAGRFAAFLAGRFVAFFAAFLAERFADFFVAFFVAFFAFFFEATFRASAIVESSLRNSGFVRSCRRVGC